MTDHGANAAALDEALAAMPLGVWVVGADQRLVLANAATRQVTGIDPAETPPGLPVADLVRRYAFRGIYGEGDPDSLAAEHLAIDRSRPFRRLFRRTDGASFEQVGMPLAAGGYVATVVEVTGYAALTQEAQGRARRLETLLAHLHGGVAAYDAERCVLFNNPAYENLLGLPRGTLRPGTSYETLFAMLAERGEFANLDAEAVIADRRQIDRTRPTTYQRVRPNGDALRIESQPLPEGGYLVELIDISAARRAEAEARRRAALLDGVLASLPHGVVVYGADGRVAMVNAAHQAIMAGAELAVGEHRDEITRRRAEQGEYGAEAPAMLALLQPQAISQSMAPLQRTRPDGRVLDLRYAPLPDGGIVQVTTDITALHAARAEATGRAAQLQVMLDNMRHGIALYDAELRLVVSNPLAAKLTGLPADSMRPGRHILDMVREQAARGVFGGPAETERVLATALAVDRRRPSSRIMHRPDGSVVEVVTDPTPDGGYVVTFGDVTARARAQAAEQAQAALLQVALESMRHGFILYDAEARVVAANAIAADCCGLAPEDVVPGRSLDEVLRQQLAAGIYGTGEAAEATLRMLLGLDRSQPFETRRPLPDGRVMEMRSAPTPAGGFVVTLTDITALAQAEAAARERANLLQAMLDNMRHGIVVFGADHRVLAANDLCSTLGGMAPGTVRPGRGLPELVAERVAANGPFEPDAAAAAIAEDLGLDRQRPHRRERPNAHGRMVSVASDPLPDGGFVISYVDTTAVHAARAEAQHRALLLQTMQDSMRHGIALFGPDQRLIVANRLAPDLAGMPAEEMVPGITPRDLAMWQLRHGVFGQGPDAEAEALDVAQRDRSRSHPVRRRMPDGRVVDSVSDPTPDGGFVITWTDVTAQVAAEEAAADRTATLQAMIDTMHHGVVLFGPDHRFIADNRLARELAGVPDAMAVPGASFAEMTAQLFSRGATGDAALDAQFGHMVVTADRRRPLHYIRPLPDGRTLEVFSDPMPDGGFVITLSDITPLARAEAEAKQRAATQAVMLDVIRHGIALFGPDRRLVAANRLAAELSGVPADFLSTGMRFDDAVRHQHDTGVFGTESEAILQRALTADRAQTLRYHRRAPDGRLIEVVSDPTADGGFALTYSDITALAAAEAAAASRAATLQAALDNMRHGLLIYGADRRLLAANALAAELSALAPEDVTPGAAFDDLLRRQHAAGLFGTEPEATAVLRRLLAADRTMRGRRMRPLADGRLVEVFTDPTPDGGFVISFTDITARARAEADAKQRAGLLRDALDSMRHGLMLFGPDRRLLTANRLAGPDYGLPDLRGREGTPFETLVAEQDRAGEFGPGSTPTTGPLHEEVLRLDRSRSQRYRRQRVDGKVIEIGSDPTPDGGFVVTHTDVTELARAQDEATARAAVLQLMLDNMRHGIAHFDRDKRLVTANRLAADFNGFDPALLQPGVDAAELALASMRAGMITAEAVQAGLTDDYTRPQRRSRVRPDGRVIEIFTDPTPDGGFVATYSDVTALTAAEAEARERARILQVMLDNLRHGIQMFDVDQRLVAANRLAADLTGYPAAQLPEGIRLADLIDTQFAAGAVPGDASALRTMAQSIDRSRPARYVRPHRDGRIIEVTSDPTPGGGFVITMADISALARAEAETQQRATVLQAMLDNIRHGIALFDAAGRILAVNPVLLALLDLPEEIMRTGGSFDGFIDYLLDRGEYGSGEEGRAVAARLKARDRREPARSTRTRPNGRVLEIASEPVPGGGFVLALTDVTEDRRIRGELEAAKDAAETANRTKSRFLATMSHELRTPLNAVIGFSEAISADPDPERGKEYVRSIHEAGRHLLSLIDDILDVTRAETIGFSTTEAEVPPIPLLEGVVRVMQATAAAAGVAVVAALPPALPLLRADALRLRQVLLNLVSNAVKFTPQGGLVTVSAEAPAEGGLVMRVTDSGIGIKPEDIPRAFEPFTQLDSSLSRRFPGSGLGLYLSRALAEAQGATLTLESVPGAGTTAMLRFPKSRLITSLAA